MHSLIPSLPHDESVFRAFSLVNSNLIQNSLTRGLNLGFNTPDPPEIVAEHRSMWLKSLKIDHSQLVLGNQVHSNHVEYVTGPGVLDDTDGLITSKRGLILGILVADCAALLMADKKNGVIAAVHAGWRGAAAGIHQNSIDKMVEAGAQISEISVWISPCLDVANFEIGEEVAGRFPEQYSVRGKYSKPHLDLKRYLKESLQELGVHGDRIVTDLRCTYSESSLFHSYRRQKDKSGRMMAIIALL